MARSHRGRGTETVAGPRQRSAAGPFLVRCRRSKILYLPCAPRDSPPESLKRRRLPRLVDAQKIDSFSQAISRRVIFCYCTRDAHTGNGDGEAQQRRPPGRCGQGELTMRREEITEHDRHEAEDQPRALRRAGSTLLTVFVRQLSEGSSTRPTDAQMIENPNSSELTDGTNRHQVCCLAGSCIKEGPS